MAKGLIRKAAGAFAVAGALTAAVMSGDGLEDAERVVDLGVEKDGKALMYADGTIRAIDPEDARCADMDNCQGLAQFVDELQQATVWTTPEELQNAMGTYQSERMTLSEALGQELPDALNHVNIAHPTRDDVPFIRQGFTDLLNAYGAVPMDEKYVVEQVDLEGLTTVHNALYNAEQTLQAYKDFEEAIDKSPALADEVKSQIKFSAKVKDLLTSPEMQNQPKVMM